MATKPVTIKEEKWLMKQLLANAAHCTMLSKRDVVVLKSIRKKLNIFNKELSFFPSST